MFIIKVCSEQIEDVCREFTNEGLKAEIQQSFLIEVDEPRSKEAKIREIITTKDLPVFVDIA